MIRGSAVVALTVALVGAMPARAEPASETNALGWLQRMVEAVHGRNYIGRFVFQHGDRLEAMEIRHFATPDGEKSHLITLDGPRAEIVHDDQRVLCLGTKGATFALDRYHAPKALSPLVPRDPRRLVDSYRLESLGDSRIAGRAAVVVGVSPRDRYRYGLRLFLDRHTALPLRADRLDADEHLLSRVQFVSLMAGAEVAGFDDDLLAAEAGQHYATLRKQTATVSSAPDDGTHAPRWRFTGLPPGYRLVGHRRLSSHGIVIEHYMFSDGLSSFSVYLEPPDADGIDGLVHIGTVHAFGRKLDGRHVTVIGEVPGETVERIASGIQPLGSERTTLAAAPSGAGQ